MNEPSLILRRKAVEARVGISRSSLYAAIKSKSARFPKPIRILPGGRAVGWVAAEVDQWIADRIAQRN